MEEFEVEEEGAGGDCCFLLRIFLDTTGRMDELMCQGRVGYLYNISLQFA